MAEVFDEMNSDEQQGVHDRSRSPMDACEMNEARSQSREGFGRQR
jgi:hypothetical protein